MGQLTLNQTAYTFEAIEKKYRDFLAPTFQILINGANITTTVAVSRITVETSVETEANSFNFTVNNAFDIVKREFQWLDEYFAVGTYIEIKFGYVDKLETLLYGLITSVTCDFPSEGGLPKLMVRGMDISFLMMRGLKSRSWEQKKFSEVAAEVGKQYVSDVSVDDSGEAIDIIAQNECNDFQFLTQMAKEINYDFFIVGKTMYFRKALTQMTPVMTLVWGKTLRSFTPEMNIASQIGEVVVRSWDPIQTQLIEASSTQVTKLGGNSKTGKDIMNALGTYKEYVYTNVDTVQEAQKKADAILNHKAMQLISGNGECIGIPELIAGRYLTLEGVGQKLSQPYYLKAVTHTIDSSGYIIRFKVGGNAV
ncbi:phage late control D family protein [Paenibacillus sp. 481]|uniref:phage late control D family protein n=1 Tax=Paenibacillus sp. 481 TaxID=2835869 RepID=UPI001E63D178|nr:hypothetical protein [Paenibacillus sp. 481]UHA73464.1 phage late control D family protein [Paenibacillus sp. 481]